MIKTLFRKTPTVEEVRERTIIYMKVHKIMMPNDVILVGDKTDGFAYALVWKSAEQQKLFVARCKDVRRRKLKINFNEQAILTG